MDQIITTYPLISLFFLSFAASTLLPLGSEWLLVLLVVNGLPPYLTVTVATAGNFLGAFTTYVIGRWGADFLISNLLRIGPEGRMRARRIYGRWGVWSLLFSWLPVVGDPLCLVAGMLKTNFLLFSVLVIAGKLFRYFFVARVALSTLG